MPHKSILILFLSSFFFLSQCSLGNQAVVERIVGKAVLIRDDKTTLLHPKQKLMSKDRIKTMADSVVILRLGKIETEIQSEAEFVIADGGNKKDLRLLKGSAWTKVKKLSSSDSLNFSTPLSIAGIRGTTFYTFQIGDIWGTCHCEGDVDFATPDNHYNARHHQDQLVVTRGSKTVVINGDELKRRFGFSHHHSRLPDSPIGEQNTLTSNQLAAFGAYLDSRLRQAP